MSTKIINGFRFQSRDLVEIHDLVAAWRKTLASRHRADLAELIADMCVDIIDGNAMEPMRFAGKSPYDEARSEIRTRQKEILGSGSRDPQVDFDFEVSILPHEGSVYGMVFSERQKWIDLWMDQDGLEDYSYWNNTDRPDDVTDAEWECRGKTWDAILLANPAGTPGMAGFTAQCADRFNKPEVAEIMRSIPTFESRVARQARNSAVGRVYARMEEEEREPANPFGTLMKIERWLSGDGSHVLEEERIRVASILPREVTADMIFSKLPPATAAN